MSSTTHSLRFNNWKKYNPRSDIKRPWWFALSNEFFTDPDFHDFSDQERLTLIYLLCETSRQRKANGAVVISDETYWRNTGFKKEVLNSCIEKLIHFKILVKIRTDHERDPNAIRTESVQHMTGQDRVNKLTSSEEKEEDGNSTELFNRATPEDRKVILAELAAESKKKINP